MYVYTRLLNIVTSHQRASIVTFWIPQIHWVIPLCVVTINRKESVVEKWRFKKNFYTSTVLSVMLIPFAKLTKEPMEEKKFVAGTGDLWMVLCHSMNVGSVVETLKPYLMPKKLCELFALTGGGDAKPSDPSVCVQAWVLVPSLVSEPPGETFTNYFLVLCHCFCPRS